MRRERKNDKYISMLNVAADRNGDRNIYWTIYCHKKEEYMIAVIIPDSFGIDYFRWVFEGRKAGNKFRNKAEAINYLQRLGLRDSEIGTLNFIVIGE